MAQAVRRKWAKTLPDGTRVIQESRKWYAEYIDANGERQRVPGYTDKGATEQLAARLERESARDAEGLGDPLRVHRKKPLADFGKGEGKGRSDNHLTDYAAVLTGKGDTKGHVLATVARVKAFLEGCGFRTIDDVDPARAAEWLSGLRLASQRPQVPPGQQEFKLGEIAAILGLKKESVGVAVARYRLPASGYGKSRRFPRATVEELASRTSEGLGPGTVNGYIRAIRGFFRWLLESKRAHSNPLASLKTINAQVEVRRGRRELSAGELQKLLTAAKESDRAFRSLAGPDRYYLYLVAATTGFRAVALASLTPADFDLDSGIVTLPARFNKNRKTKEQPIPRDVVEQLRCYLSDRPTNVPVWGVSWSGKHGAQMIRIDLEAAGIPYSVPGPDGPEYADFHALRHSYLTLGGRSGIDLRTLQELAGHSSPTLTARYSHRRLHDLAGAVEKLPSIVPLAAGSTPGAAAS